MGQVQNHISKNSIYGTIPNTEGFIWYIFFVINPYTGSMVFMLTVHLLLLGFSTAAFSIFSSGFHSRIDRHSFLCTAYGYLDQKSIQWRQVLLLNFDKRGHFLLDTCRIIGSASFSCGCHRIHLSGRVLSFHTLCLECIGLGVRSKTSPRKASQTLISHFKDARWSADTAR